MTADVMGHPRGTLLLLWAPGRLLRELQACAVPELQQQYRLAAVKSAADTPDSALHPPPMPPLALSGGGLLAEAAPASELQRRLLLQAAAQCTLLTAALQPLASAASLEAAAAAALARLGGAAAAALQLRVLVLGTLARAPAERALRQRLQGLGIGSAAAAGQPHLWCISREQQLQQQQPGDQPTGDAANVILGLELAIGAAPPPARRAARQLGPTAMPSELSALSACLAGVQRGDVALDPFCGSGSLLFAALERGAALALGSDIDATHFGTAGDANSGGSGSGQPVLLQADAARLAELLPAGSVDALVTDLPYGYRTSVVAPAAPLASNSSSGGGGLCPAERDPAAGAADAAEAAGVADWQQLLAALLALGEHVLLPGGRLLTWLPAHQAAEKQQRQLAEWGAAHRLRLRHLLPEVREAGYPRAVALFERLAGSSSKAADVAAAGPMPAASRRELLLAALRRAAEGGARVLNLPSQQQSADEAAPASAAGAEERAAAAGPTAEAVQQRGLSYKLVRGAAAGAAIDVWRAAWLGDTGAIGEYAAAGGDVNARDRKGQTPLQFAAGYGKDAAVELLLRLGADPSAAADRSGMAALARAAARNHAGVLSLLLTAGADPCQRSAAGQTPLMYAAQFGHGQAVALLLQHLADGDPAASQGGSGIGVQRHLAVCDGAGLSALHVAAQWGMPAVAEQLLQADADPNQRSSDAAGLTPAHLAARWGHTAVIRKLQAAGADLRARCSGRGWEPVQEAREWRRAGCIELLEALEPPGS